MAAPADDNASKRPYDTSATLVGSSGDSLYSASTGDLMAGPPSSTNQDGTVKSTKSIAPGVRQRLTVVCAECKRLKLRCDRRTPCQQCLKRDVVDKCIYTQAAIEKIDLQTLHNRLCKVEAMTIGIPDASAALTTATLTSTTINPGLAGSASMQHRSSLNAGSTLRGPRPLLAIGAHGSSIAVSLQGATGVWLDELAYTAPSTDVLAGGGGAGASADGVNLAPFRRIPDSGVVDTITELAKLFRVPSRFSTGTDDDDFFNSSDDDEYRYSIGVSPQLVLKLPPAYIRAQIYPRLESAQIMFPCMNFLYFKRRIESMCAWAERVSGLRTSDSAAAAGEGDVPSMNHPPTLSFLAATCAALALGAVCWLSEMDIVEPFGSTATGLSGPSRADAASPSRGSSTAGSVPPVLIDESLPHLLYRISKMAIQMNHLNSGCEALDLDYVHANTLLVRLLLLAHFKPNDGASNLPGLPNWRNKKTRRRAKGKERASPNDNATSSSNQDASMSDDTPNNEQSKNGHSKPDTTSVSLPPEMVGLVGELVANARLMGLGHDPDLVAGGRLSLFEKEMRRRLWWEVVCLDAFVADCTGEDPLLSSKRFTTRLPSNVDDDLFGPDSANLPAPNTESMHGNIEYFIERCRLVQIVKHVGQRLELIYDEYPDGRPPDGLLRVKPLLQEITDWHEQLPEHLQMKEVPVSSQPPSIKSAPVSSPMSSIPMSPVSQIDHGGSALAFSDSPFAFALRCDLAISAWYSIVRFTLPFVREHAAARKVEVSQAAPGNFDILSLLEPSMSIVHTWRFLHSSFKHIRPSMFMCYAFTRNLFDSAVVLAHLVIQRPLYAASAFEGVGIALDLLRDPTVLTGRRTAGVNTSRPSEAVRIVEALADKAEAALSVRGIPAGSLKRKREDSETADALSPFLRLPFTGVGASAAPLHPPGILSNAAGTNDGRVATRPSRRSVDSPTARPRTKKATADKGGKAGEPKAPASRKKHEGVTVRRRTTTKKDAKSTGESTTPTNQPVPAPPPLQLPAASQPAPALPQQAVSPQAPAPAQQQGYFTSPEVGPTVSQHFMVQQNASVTGDFPVTYREDGSYGPATYAHAHAPPYDHHAPVPVPSQVHGAVDYERYVAPSTSHTHSTTAQNHHQGYASSSSMEYSITSQHPANFGMLSRLSTRQAYGRGSIDNGPPSAQMPSQTQPFHPHGQPAEPMQPQERTAQAVQAWQQDYANSSWNYTNI